MKKLKYILFIAIALVFNSKVYADKIYNVTMDVYINKSGTASIKEIWDVQASGGSEWYKQFYNMGSQELQEYTVWMDGNILTKKDNWDIEESLSEKSGYYGINYVSEGFELCFGKSDMKRHQFTLVYNLTNVIFNTDDKQVLYQTFLPNATLDNFSITVSSFFEFPDTLPVWGYGYKGYAYVANGKIGMSNEEHTSLNNEYVVLLAEFEPNTFETSLTVDKYDNSSTVESAAKEGSYKHNYGPSVWEIIIKVFQFLISFIPFIVVGIFAFKSANKFGTKNIKFYKNYKKLKDVPHFREIPLNKDVFKAYWISCHYGLIKNKTDFLGAILLKWLKDGNVENVTVTTTFLKKEEKAIKLVSSNNLNEYELKLYNMMYEASKDGVLEKNEFTKWCRNHYEKILKWFTDVIDNTTMTFVGEGLITEEKKTFSKVYNVSPSMQELAYPVVGLRSFLNEFSNIKDRESIEVKLWEEYLIFAQIFGIAKKVAQEFKKLYPDVITDADYDNVIFIHNVSYSGVHAATSARAAAENYSAGGGGFSSGGGGGGSFGGGGSMGGR